MKFSFISTIYSLTLLRLYNRKSFSDFIPFFYYCKPYNFYYNSSLIHSLSTNFFFTSLSPSLLFYWSIILIKFSNNSLNKLYTLILLFLPISIIFPIWSFYSYKIWKKSNLLVSKLSISFYGIDKKLFFYLVVNDFSIEICEMSSHLILSKDIPLSYPFHPKSSSYSNNDPIILYILDMWLSNQVEKSFVSTKILFISFNFSWILFLIV